MQSKAPANYKAAFARSCPWVLEKKCGAQHVRFFGDILLMENICGSLDWVDSNKVDCTLIIPQHRSMKIFSKGVSLASWFTKAITEDASRAMLITQRQDKDTKKHQSPTEWQLIKTSTVRLFSVESLGEMVLNRFKALKWIIKAL